MKTRKFLTLTRSRQIDALCWVLILAASLLARLYPVRSLPLPLRVGAAAVLLAMAAAIILIAAGVFTEKGTSAPPKTSAGPTPPCLPFCSSPWAFC